MADYTSNANPGGVRPNMHKMFDGRNIATRPIPVIIDSSDLLAIRVAAANFRPKTYAVKMASGPRPKGTDVVFGTQVAGGAKLAMGTFNPGSGLMETL
jgi:hypothetical protein